MDSVQAFRSCVNCRRQPGRTAANDGDITNARFMDCSRESQASSQLLGGGIAQHGFSTADYNRDFVDLQAKSIEHLLSGRVTVKVNVRVWMSVPGEKLAQAQRVS
ncbi:MAG: hypothetical protein ABSG96_24770 [Terracidiphilus sp.]|jgi:hypothetical protein